MNIGYKGILSELGYDTDLLGSMFFIDLLGDVCTLLNEGKDNEEIRKLLPSYYLEYYHFCYEVPRVKYFKELDKFCNSRVVSDDTKSANKELMDGVPNLELEDLLILLANKLIELEKIKNTAKIMVKAPYIAKIIEKV